MGKFLDIELKPNRTGFVPFRKPNNNLAYTNVKSNQPRNIFKHISKRIDYRLSTNSSKVEIFDKVKRLQNDPKE